MTKLKIAELTPREAGRGLARVDPAVAREMGLSPGDVILIEGRRTTVARVWPGDTGDVGLVRVDGATRHNAGAGIDDHVEIKPVEAKPAKLLTLAPVEALKLVDSRNYLQ